VQKIFQTLLKAYKAFLIILTLSLFIIVGVNVFCRYVLNSSLSWADELSRFIFIWVSFLGAVLAYGYNEHIGLDFVVDRIPSPTIKRFIRLAADFFILLVIVILLRYGLIVANSATNLSPALYIPMKWVYIIAPVSAFMMLIINICKIYEHLALLLGWKRSEA
jgi:TRAP-type C4-dicarboxylate transport system permease small subunit